MNSDDLFAPRGPGGVIRLDDRQRLDWLQLIRSESVGPRTFRTLINRFGSAAAALRALPDLARKAGRPALRLCSREEAEQEWQATAALGARFVALGEAGYPRPLAVTDTPPPLLAVLGQEALLQRPMLAVVGSRNASAAGSRMAEILAAGAGAAGMTVVSGLARGIDARAHRASLGSGTVAVLAGGLARPYPPENVPLFQMIAEQGCVLSEMPIDCVPRAREFPRRNRIVSGLSLGTLVVEAARRSGSLITARFALEQGREVFAVPGSPLDPRAEGTNDLIRNGATMVTRWEDILEVIAPQIESGDVRPAQLSEDRERKGREETLWDELIPDEDEGAAATTPVWEGPEEEATPPTGSDPLSRVMEVLGPSPAAVDDIARILQLDIRMVQAALFELEMSGRLERQGGNRVALVRPAD